MAYPSKQRKQLSKLSKKNKTKATKTKKTKRTRIFKKQYGGKLNGQQIEYIKHQIEDLGFSNAQKEELIGNFNEISQRLSKPSSNGKTLLESFFDNLNRNYGQRNQNPAQKREIFLGMLSNMYYNLVEKDPDTDSEDTY